MAGIVFSLKSILAKYVQLYHTLVNVCKVLTSSLFIGLVIYEPTEYVQDVDTTRLFVK